VVNNSRLIGGAPLNVCYHLSRHGIESKLISQVGNDARGIELLSAVSQLGIDTSFISLSATHPTSEVLVDLSAEGKVSYTIVENVAWDVIPFEAEKSDEVSRAECFVYGSLASRSPITKNSLFSYLPRSNWKVLDLNLRSPYFDKSIVQEMLLSSDTLKINDDELWMIAGFFDWSALGKEEIVREIFRLFPNNKEIILTLGAEGAEYFSGDLHLRVPAVKVNVSDTVGSGDAFLAAFLSGKLKQKPIQQCLEDAARLSAFVAGSRGACPEYSGREEEV
jgi:fructokinase